MFITPITLFNQRDKGEAPAAIRNEPAAEPVSSTIDGLTWVSQAGKDSSLDCRLEADSGSRWLDKPLHVVVMSYHRPLCHASLQLSGQRLRAAFNLSCGELSGYTDILLFADSNLLGRQSLCFSQKQMARVSCHPDTLDRSPHGYNSWDIHIEDSILYNCSVSVTDADRTPSPPLDILYAAGPDPLDYRKLLAEEYPHIKRRDTSYLAWKGMATRESGKPLKNAELVAMIMTRRNSASPTTLTIPIDSSGQFLLKGLFFFDTAQMHFQLNHKAGEKSSDIHLSLEDDFPIPPFHCVPAHGWIDTMISVASITKEDTARLPAFSRVKLLDTVTVTRRKDPREELDNRYATGIFSEPTLFSYDIRNETRYYEIDDFLRTNLPGYERDPSSNSPTCMGHVIVFYLNDQLSDWEMLKGYEFKELAYVKAFPPQQGFVGDDPFVKWVSGYKGATMESVGGSAKGSLKVPEDKEPWVVCIYLKKGTDFRTMESQLKNLPLPGYAPITLFSGAGANGRTLYWDPLVRTNDFRIRFRNNAFSRRFRICIEGVRRDGRVVRFERIVE